MVDAALLEGTRMPAQETPWNSLEVAKLIVGVLTPLAVVVLGFLLAKQGRRAEAAAAEAARRADERAQEVARRADEAEWANRRAVERLIELHKEMSPLLNDLHCFFQTIGHFREISPPAVIDRKRRLDRLFYANQHLFSSAFIGNYGAFIGACFDHWGTAGGDAKIKMVPSRLQVERGLGAWDHSWDSLFVRTHAAVNRRKQAQTYDAAMQAFASDLGLARRPQ